MSLDEQRALDRSLARRAEGSEYIKVPDSMVSVPTEAAQRMEKELRKLTGASLIESSGKLALLDRLLSRVRAEDSRILLFSQYTQTLDVLTEYTQWRFGPEGRGYMRLDGSTNR